jgi:hypothetical protein
LFPLRRLLRLPGLRWRYSNPPPTWRGRSLYIAFRNRMVQSKVKVRIMKLIFTNSVHSSLETLLLCYTCHSVNSSSVLTRLSGLRSRPTISQKIWERRQSNLDFWICSQELWPPDHRGGQLYSRGWVDPVPDPLLLRKSGSAGNRTRATGSVARNSDH